MLPIELPEPSADALEVSAELKRVIRAELRASGGWLDFARYMELALYAPGLGYYSAGSTKLGSYVTLAGQVGIAGHLQIGNQVTIAAQSGVMDNIPDGEKWLGTPARPDRQMKRIYIGWERLPELLQRVLELEKRLGDHKG